MYNNNLNVIIVLQKHMLNTIHSKSTIAKNNPNVNKLYTLEENLKIETAQIKLHLLKIKTC